MPRRAGIPRPGSDASSLGQDVVAAVGDLAEFLDADFGGLPSGVGCGGFPDVPRLVGFGGIVFTGDGLRIDPPLGIPRMSCSSSKTAGSP